MDHDEIEIARIIDPEAMSAFGTSVSFKMTCRINDALKKADAIMALTSQPETAEEAAPRRMARNATLERSGIRSEAFRRPVELGLEKGK